MFSLTSKSKLSLRVDTASADTPKTKTGIAKSYLIGMATTSQKLIRKQSNSPHEAPLTPEDNIISLPIAAPSTLSSREVSDRDGLSTPPASNKKPARHDMPSKTSFSYQQFATQPADIFAPSSTVSSLPSNEHEAECVFCSVGVSFTNESDPVHRLKCGHHAHDRCLYRLNGSVKELGNYDVLCSMCERPATHFQTHSFDAKDVAFTSAADFAPGFRSGISAPISNQLATRVMARSSSFGVVSSSASSIRLSMRHSQSYGGHRTGTIAGLRYPNRDTSQSSGLLSPLLGPEEPTSPVSSLGLANRSDSSSVSTGRATLLSNPSRPGTQESVPSQPSALDSSYAVSKRDSGLFPTPEASLGSSWLAHSARKELSSLLDGEHASTVKCSPNMHPFRVLTATDQPSDGKTRVLITIQPKPKTHNKDPRSEYRFTAKDIQHSIKVRQDLAKMKFDYKDVALADMTTLRLHSQASVTSPDSRTLDWKDCDAYLFENILIITRFFKVTAAMSLKHSKATAHVEPSRTHIVELHFDNPDIIDINLNMASPTLAFMWKHAFEDPRAHFPLAPGISYDGYVSRLEDYLRKGDMPMLSPMDAILCLPVSSSSQALVMQQALRVSLNALTYRDRLGVVLYNQYGVLRKIELSAPHSASWAEAFNGVGGISDTLTKSPCTLDAVLNAAQQLLLKHRPLDSTASILLVSDSEMSLQVFSSQLIRSRVPVQTIGLTEHHDAMGLSMLAQHLKGAYYNARSNSELENLLSSLIRHESSYTHKNVTLRLKPRISTHIVGVWGGETAPSFEAPNSVYPDLQPRTHTLDDNSSVLCWRLDAMRMGDIRSLVIEVDGDVPPGSDILQVGLEAANVLSPDDTACSCSFRVPVPPATEAVDDRLESLLITSIATRTSIEGLELAVLNILQGESRAAYDQLLTGLQRLQSVHKSGSVVSHPMLALLEAYQTLLDMCCDEIVKHTQHTKSFMHYLLQKLWILHTQHSLFARDQLEEMYCDQSLSLE